MGENVNSNLQLAEEGSPILQFQSKLTAIAIPYVHNIRLQFTETHIYCRDSVIAVSLHEERRYYYLYNKSLY